MAASAPARAPAQGIKAAAWGAFPAWTGARAAYRARVWWLVGLAGALLASVPAWLPWLDPRLDLWQVDDAKNHMLRIYVLGWLLEHGVWYPRWAPDLYMGYGYPVFNYYAPVFYYLALLLKGALRLDVWDAYRATGGAAALLGAAGVYALVAAVWRRAALGVLAAVALLYGPYAFQLNLYKRGAIPEALGLALLPWLLLAIWQAWRAVTPGRAAAWTAGAAAAGAAAILVHNLTALLSAGVAAAWVAYLLVARPSGRGLRRARAAGLLAAALSAFFWLPALGEGHAVQLERLQTEELNYRQWLLDVGGNTARQRLAEYRPTRTGLVDLHLSYPSHYPQELAAAPKLSLTQAGLGVLAVLSLAAGALRARPTAGAARSAGPRPPTDRQLPSSVGGPRSSVGGGAGPLAPLLLVAGACWFLTFTVSAPVWRAVPPLQLLQFPWRLLGPLGVCLAIAGAGALAAPLGWLARRWDTRGQVLGWAVLALVAGATLANGLGDRRFLFEEAPVRTIDGRTLVADEAKDRLGFGTTSGREFLPRDVQIAVYTAFRNAVREVAFPRDQAVFERLYPERDWLGGLLYPLAGDLRFLGWRAEPLRLGVRVANDAAEPGQVGIRQLRFLGWRAWLDGRPAPIGVPPYVPEQQAALGFMVVEVPPGEHTLGLAFGPTPLRLAGAALAVLGALAAAAWLARFWGKAYGWPRPWLAAGWLAAAAGLGGLVWRGAWPMIPPLAAAPVPAAQFADGVWRAAGLDARGAGLLVNVAEAARTGRARIDSPSGASLGPERFVDVRHLTVRDADDPERGAPGTSRRQWLYLHPPSEVAVDVALPPRQGLTFQAALALDPTTWAAPVGDGVRFQALVTRLGGTGRPPAPQTGGPAPRPGGGAGTLAGDPGRAGEAGQAGQAGEEAEPVAVLDTVINPRSNAEHRRWVPVTADLTPWAGASVRLTLKTLPRDDLSYDWAGWGNPVVAVARESARVPPATR